MIARTMLPHFANGSGGVVSTAQDLARWLMLQTHAGVAVDGRAIVSARSLDVMHTPSAAGGDYAMGWEQDALPAGGVRLEHGGTPFTFSADQAIYPRSGYGFVVLFNSCSALGVEQVSFIDGLSAIISGEQPEPGAPASMIADSVLALLTLLALIGGVQQLRRGRSWASRHVAAPRWRTALALGVRLIPLALFAALPMLAGLVFGNRDVTWTSSVYGWLALVVWAATAAGINAAVAAARAFYLLQGWRQQCRRNAARSERLAV
jgi:hypothetical protein